MGRWRPPAESASPYITASGYTQLQLEMRALLIRRADTVTHLAAAAAEGDRSENAEYIYRRKELREIDRRMGYLQRRLPALKIIDTPPADPQRVFFGAWIELEDATGGKRVFRIVGADESDAPAGHISVDSPMARQLLKRSLGDELEIRGSAASRRYVLTRIRYAQPGGLGRDPGPAAGIVGSGGDGGPQSGRTPGQG